MIKKCLCVNEEHNERWQIFVTLNFFILSSHNDKIALKFLQKYFKMTVGLYAEISDHTIL